MWSRTGLVAFVGRPRPSLDRVSPFQLDDSYIERVSADDGSTGVRSVSVVVDDDVVGEAVERLGANGASFAWTLEAHSLLPQLPSTVSRWSYDPTSVILSPTWSRKALPSSQSTSSSRCQTTTEPQRLGPTVRLVDQRSGHSLEPVDRVLDA